MRKRAVHGRARWGSASMSHKEIADKLGIHVNTVQQNEMRALQKIRAAIEAEAAASDMTVHEWLFDNPPEFDIRY